MNFAPISRIIAILWIMSACVPEIRAVDSPGGYVIIGNEGQLAFLDSWENGSSLRYATDRLNHGWGRYVVQSAVALERADSSDIFVSACCPGMLLRVRLTKESWSDDSVTGLVLPKGMALEETDSLFESTEAGAFIIVAYDVDARENGGSDDVSILSIDASLQASPASPERILSAEASWALFDWLPPFPAVYGGKVINTSGMHINPSWVFRPYAKTRGDSLYVTADAGGMPTVVTDSKPKMSGTMYLQEDNGEQTCVFLLAKGAPHLMRNGIVYIDRDRRMDMTVYSRNGNIVMNRLSDKPIDILGDDGEWMFLGINESALTRMRITQTGVEDSEEYIRVRFRPRFVFPVAYCPPDGTVE